MTRARRHQVEITRSICITVLAAIAIVCSTWAFAEWMHHRNPDTESISALFNQN